MTTTTMRMPDDMSEALRSAAAAKGISINQLVLTLIAEHLKRDEERRLFDGFTQLGEDAKESDVEFAIHAASEVVLRDG